MFTFKESHTRQTVKSFSKMPFYQTMHNRTSAKKAKPALCFARIAKAILGDVTLHNSNFLLIKENPGECFPVHKNVHSGIRINIGLCSITQWMSLRNL